VECFGRRVSAVDGANSRAGLWPAAVDYGLILIHREGEGRAARLRCLSPPPSLYDMF